MSVLCLIANPQNPVLTPKLIQTIHAQTGGEINWLHQTIACEIIAPKSPDNIAIAQELLRNYPVDIVTVPRANRRKKLLLADMDSTIIEQECIDELADALDIKSQIATITEKTMRGELDFTEALATRVKLLKGLDLATIKQVRRERITMTNGGRVLVHTMKQFGAHTVLISGGFSLFADYFAKRIGFDQAFANNLEFDGNDTLTGTVLPPIIDSASKVNQLKKSVIELEINLNDTLAVGDGANDLPMLLEAAMGVALHAKPHVAGAAPYRIEHSDLTALLYMQGYNEEEFVR